jgi:hypothetical protein
MIALNEILSPLFMTGESPLSILTINITHGLIPFQREIEDVRLLTTARNAHDLLNQQRELKPFSLRMKM